MATKTTTTTTSKTTTKKAAPKKAAPKKATRTSANAARAKSAAKSKATSTATAKQAKKRSRRERTPDSAGGRAMSIHRNLAAKPKRVSLLDAAATVLASARAPMTAKAIVDEVTTKGLWTSGKGKTPHATLYAAMIREIAKKEKDARFKKIERGLFTAA